MQPAYKCLWQGDKWTIEDTIARDEAVRQHAIEWWSQSPVEHGLEAMEVIQSMMEHLWSLIGG